MNLIEAKNISKNFITSFGLTVELFEDISFELRESEILTFLAPRESGKTTLLKISSSFLKPDKGEVRISTPPVYIPGEPNSFPWLNVKGNVLFANSVVPQDELNATLEFVGLDGYGNHFPNNISTGFRFRISLARALVLRPKVIVLDEPFVSVRHDVKKELFDLVLKTKEEKNIAFLIATSNITEAVYLSDRIIQLSKHPGKIINEINAADFIKVHGKDSNGKIKSEIESKFREFFNENIFDFSI